MKLWDSQSGALLATFVLLPPPYPGSASTEWIIFTPTGHYIGSEGASRFIRWRVEEELHPAQRFERVYCSPEEVERVLGG